MGLVGLCKDEHTLECGVETKFFQAETMKEVRRKIKEKAAGSKTVIGDGLAAGVGKSSKKKAESTAPEKVAKRTKKEKTVKDTHATEPLPQANAAVGSIPLVKDDVTGEPAEPTEFWEKVDYMRRKLGLQNEKRKLEV